VGSERDQGERASIAEQPFVGRAVYLKLRYARSSRIATRAITISFRRTSMR